MAGCSLVVAQAQGVAKVTFLNTSWRKAVRTNFQEAKMSLSPDW